MSAFGVRRARLRAGLWCAALAWLAVVAARDAGAQTPPPAASVPAPPALQQVTNVGGRWELNWQESDKPPEEPEVGDPDKGGRGGRGGPPPGSGGGGGVIGGLFGGGQMSGGRGRGGDQGRGRAEGLETMREHLAAARTLLIVERPNEVTITDEHGEALTLVTDAVKVRETRNGRTTERRAYWDGRMLVVETSPGGKLKIMQTYRKEMEGLQLVVTTKVEGGPRGEPIELRRVYDQALEK